MKTRRIATFFICLCLAGKVFAQINTDSIPLIMADSLKAVYIYADTGTAINQVDAKGRKQGLWQKKYSNGVIRYRGHFYNNNPVGVFKYYYNNDSVESIVTYCDKGKVAYATAFYENGGVLSLGKYVNHLQDSIWVYYDPNTKLYKKEQYVLGKKEGKSIVFFPNGNVVEITTWHNNMQNGLWKRFFDNGQLNVETTYINGVLDGPAKIYAEGNPDEPEIWGNYKNDRKNGRWIYVNQNTGAADTVVYKNGQLADKKYRLTQQKMDSLGIKYQPLQRKLDEPGSLQDEYKMGNQGGGGR